MDHHQSIDYSKYPQNNILCVDMKSFYASVEIVQRGFNPLTTHLAVVGDLKRSGSVVLAASSALKKKYGIKTGSRLYEIPHHPEILVVEARMDLYLQRSLDITRLFNQFVPLHAIHVYSIDEAWLKLNGTEHILGPPKNAAERIKDTIMEEYGLPCSMGLGPNMFLAKVAMDTEGKKKGLAEWTYEDVPHRLWPLKIRDCWGIGARLTRKFHNIGVKTVGDLAHLPLPLLERRFGIMGNQLYYHAWGIDLSPFEGQYQPKPKSLGRSITLMRDYQKREELETVVFELCEEVTRRAREYGLAGRVISLCMGYSLGEVAVGFQTRKTLKECTNLVSEVYRACQTLMDQNYRGQIVRQISLSLGGFGPSSNVQLHLFHHREAERRVLWIMDRLQEEYGYQALFYGRSLKEGSIKERMKTTIGGHKASVTK